MHQNFRHSLPGECLKDPHDGNRNADHVFSFVPVQLTSVSLINAHVPWDTFWQVKENPTQLLSWHANTTWLCGYRFIILSTKSTKNRATTTYLPIFGFYWRLHLPLQSIYLIVLYVSIQCHVLSFPLSGRTQEVFMSIKDLESSGWGKRSPSKHTK